MKIKFGFIKKSKEGSSLLEAIVGLAIFGLMAVSISSLAVGGFIGVEQGGEFAEAEGLAQEGVEAIRNIRDQAWNELQLTTTSVSISGSEWIFDGEGSTEQIGQFTRTIRFHDVCRDSSNDIVDCPGSYTDPHTKRVEVAVAWDVASGVTESVERFTFVSNWDSEVWTQTNWAGGDGQTIWSDVTRYDSDDSNIDVSTSGQVTLASLGGNGCGLKTWDFVTPGNYEYVTTSIEIDSGIVQLISEQSDGIADSEIDSLEFDTSYGQDPDVINISGNIYAIAYEGNGNDGYLATVEIDSSGNITDAVIDSYEYNTSHGGTPSIAHVAGDVYAIAYEGSGRDGWVSTVEIDSSGNITNSVIDTYEFDTSNGETPDIFHISGDIFAVAYDGSGTDGWLKTLEIDSSGNITNSVVDSLEFDTSRGQYPDILPVSGDIFAIFYEGPGNDGWVKTVDIDSSGNIANSVVDSYEFDTSNGEIPDAMHISGDIFAVAYDGSGTDGWLKTLEIDSSGNITNSVVDSLEFDTSQGLYPKIDYISGNTYAVVYSNISGGGNAVTINIENNGTIDNSVADTMTFELVNSQYPFVFGISDNIFAVAHLGQSDDGWLRTLSLENSFPTDIPSINPTSSQVYDVGSIDNWASFSEVSTKNGGEIYYQLSDDGGETWKYWTGLFWSDVVLPINYNTANTVNSNIGSFPTTSASISFKAFLESDGTQDVLLDSVSVQCSQQKTWDFISSENYTYVSSSIEVTGSNAQLVSTASGGNISSSITDSYEFDSNYTQDPVMIHVSGDIYAIAYEGPSGDGFIKTVEVDSFGNITNSTIDTLEFDTSTGQKPSLVHVSGDIFAIAYEGNNDDGWLKTVDIDSSGNIANSVVDTYEFDSTKGQYPKIVHVSGDIFAIAYEGNNDDGWLKTVEIDSSGNITNSAVDTYEFDNNNGEIPDIIKVSGDIFAIVYDGPGTDGWLKTVEIDSSGNITNSIIDSLEFDTSEGQYAEIINISGDIFAIVYESNDDGWVKTVDIDSSGNIANSVIDSYEFENNNGEKPDIVHASGDYYIVVSEGNSSDGWARSIEIDNSGNITTPAIDSLEFDTDRGAAPSILALSPSSFLVAYEQSDDYNGYIKTFVLEESYPTDEPSIYPSSPLSTSEVSEFSEFSETATKNGGEIYYQFSVDGGSNWMYYNGASWATSTGSTDYNTATVVNSNISKFPTSSNQLQFKAFLESDGTQLVQLDKVVISWGGTSGGGSGYQTSGYFISSAFDMGASGPVQTLEWSQEVEDCTPACDIKVQLRTASDSGGSPGVWGSWYGYSGEDTYFTLSSGSQTPTELNGNQWIQYRVELAGDGTETPIFEDIQITYK